MAYLFGDHCAHLPGNVLALGFRDLSFDFFAIFLGHGGAMGNLNGLGSIDWHLGADLVRHGFTLGSE